MANVETRSYQLRIWRQAGPNNPGKLVDYRVDDIDPSLSFLEMLDHLNETLISKGDHPIEFESDCREGICGACGVVVDGRPHVCASCQTARRCSARPRAHRARGR